VSDILVFSSSLTRWRGLKCSENSPLQFGEGAQEPHPNPLHEWRGLKCSENFPLQFGEGLGVGFLSFFHPWSKAGGEALLPLQFGASLGLNTTQVKNNKGACSLVINPMLWLGERKFVMKCSTLPKCRTY